MPELPEVESLARFLREVAVGRHVTRVEVASLSVLKTYDPPVDALAGATLTATGRRGKFLLLEHASADGERLFLVLHLARAGWLRWKEPMPPARAKPGRGPLALRVRYEGDVGFDVTEAGTEKRVAAYVVRDPDDIEFVATLGPDPLDPGFTVDRLHDLLTSAGGSQIKGAITDQRLIAGVGNSYSDDALHLARLSPFKPASKLTADEVTRLHHALVEVLSAAIARADDLTADKLKSDKKGNTRVHGRTGQPCPVCGDTIREVSFATKSLQYCPTCQTGGKPLADRRLSRLLK
ncbi:MAG TPA: DNA-formamidopyrimidine glycosylase family protein [Acidimicrobiales bacterium]|nr:DNA-formamidopyrimidine glycosylase family protein [Acidimicrobiales bacterium]